MGGVVDAIFGGGSSAPPLPQPGQYDPFQPYRAGYGAQLPKQVNQVNSQTALSNATISGAATNIFNTNAATATNVGNVANWTNSTLNTVANQTSAGLQGNAANYAGSLIGNAQGTGTGLQANANVYATNIGSQAGLVQAQNYANQTAALMANPSSITTQPGFQFLQQQGDQAVQRQAAATGSLVSGNEMMALQQQNQGLANQFYNQQLSNLGQAQQQAQSLGTTQANLHSQGAQAQRDAMLQSSNLFGNAVQNANQMRSSAMLNGANLQTNAINQGSNAVNHAAMQGNSLLTQGYQGLANAQQGTLANYNINLSTLMQLSGAAQSPAAGYQAAMQGYSAMQGAQRTNMGK